MESQVPRGHAWDGALEVVNTDEDDVLVHGLQHAHELAVVVQVLCGYQRVLSLSFPLSISLQREMRQSRAAELVARLL